VIVPVPLFETVALCATLELLTVTLPKLSDLVDKAITGSAEGCVTFVLVYPAQAESIAKRNNSIAKQATTPDLFPRILRPLSPKSRKGREGGSLSLHGRV
jgi:hypothetical protein